MKAKGRQRARQSALRPRLGWQVVIAAGFALLALIGTYLGKGYYDVAQEAPNREVEIHAQYRFIPSLAALTQQSTLVVDGTVLDSGTTSLIAQPSAHSQSSPSTPAPLGHLPGDKASQIATRPSAPPVAPSAAAPDQSLPVTSYSIRVDAVLHGTAPSSRQLTLLLPGGPVTYPTLPLGPELHRTIVVEGNPLLVRSQREVFFLGVNPNGTYHIVGGPQSRFRIVGDAIHVINPQVPLTKGHDGELVTHFASTIRALP